MKIFFFALLLHACTAPSTSSKRDPDALLTGGGDELLVGSNENQPACNDGEKRTCHVLLGNHEGIKHCFVGTQFCVLSEWTECGSE